MFISFQFETEIFIYPTHISSSSGFTLTYFIFNSYDGKVKTEKKNNNTCMFNNNIFRMYRFGNKKKQKQKKHIGICHTQCIRICTIEKP